MLRDCRGRVARDNADARPRNPEEKRRVWLSQMEHEGIGVRCSRGRNQTKRAALRGFHSPGNNRIERKLHVRRSQFATVVKLHAVPEMEHVGKWIRSFPTLRHIRNYIHLRVVRHEARKYQSVEMGRISICTKSWVQI